MATTPARAPLVSHIFWPLRTKSSPSRSARLVIAATSEPQPGSRHRERAAHLAGRHLRQEPLLLLVGAVLREHVRDDEVGVDDARRRSSSRARSPRPPARRSAATRRARRTPRGSSGRTGPSPSSRRRSPRGTRPCARAPWRTGGSPCRRSPGRWTGSPAGCRSDPAVWARRAMGRSFGAGFPGSARRLTERCLAPRAVKSAHPGRRQDGDRGCTTSARAMHRRPPSPRRPRRTSGPSPLAAAVADQVAGVHVLEHAPRRRRLLGIVGTAAARVQRDIAARTATRTALAG